jgi:Tol biopolymer transport system component
VALSGGIPEVLAGVGQGSSGLGSGLVGAWDYQDRIFFGRGGSFGLSQLPAIGGTPKSFAELGDHADFDYPEILPEGKWVLFTDQVTSGKWSSANIVAQSVATGERKIVLKGGHFARYSPTGHLVYAQNGILFAIGFNANSIEVTGTSVPVIQNVATNERSGHAKFALAANGTLIYVPGKAGASSPGESLAWVDRNGKEELLAAPPNAYQQPRVSPDGTRVALTVVSDTLTSDIFIWDLARKTMTRLTFDDAHVSDPLWTLDSKRIVFGSDRGGKQGVYWKTADGTGKEEILGSVPDRPIIPSSWSDNGKALVLSNPAAGTENVDIGVMSMEGDRKYRPLLQEKFREAQPQISPNGRWMAYTSNESGQPQIYVRPFPDVEGGRWQVSPSGGDSPLWSRDGRELFYRRLDEVLAVSVKTEPAFNLETPKILFRGMYNYSNTSHSWDISPDGKCFLMVKPPWALTPSEGGPRKINVVLNWFEELKQRLPVK